MKNLEFNKIAAAILTAGLIAMLAGTFADMFYHPHEAKTRGYAIEGLTGNSAAEEPEAFNLAKLLAQADAEKGKKVSKKCISCHSFEQDGEHKVGPNLWAILGGGKAKKSGFAYSNAFTALEGSWDVDGMYAFLNNPKAYVKGTKMSFAGLKKPQQVADMIAYMKQQGSGNVAFPEYVPEVEVMETDGIETENALEEGVEIINEAQIIEVQEAQEAPQ